MNFKIGIVYTLYKLWHLFTYTYKTYNILSFWFCLYVYLFVMWVETSWKLVGSATPFVSKHTQAHIQTVNIHLSLQDYEIIKQNPKRLTPLRFAFICSLCFVVHSAWKCLLVPISKLIFGSCRCLFCSMRAACRFFFNNFYSSISTKPDKTYSVCVFIVVGFCFVDWHRFLSEFLSFHHFAHCTWNLKFFACCLLAETCCSPVFDCFFSLSFVSRFAPF